jgi:hypothetical protein
MVVFSLLPSSSFPRPCESVVVSWSRPAREGGDVRRAGGGAPQRVCVAWGLGEVRRQSVLGLNSLREVLSGLQRRFSERRKFPSFDKSLLCSLGFQPPSQRRCPHFPPHTDAIACRRAAGLAREPPRLRRRPRRWTLQWKMHRHLASLRLNSLKTWATVGWQFSQHTSN